MKASINSILFSSLILFFSHSRAAQVDDAVITNFGVYGTGRIFFILDKEIPETNCVKNRVDMAQGSSAASTISSIVLVALASGKKVKVRTTGCYDGYPTISASEDGWIFIKN